MPNISPASLSSRKKYSLGDFVQYARGKHEDQYAAVADLSIYKFADKAYLDENNTPCRRHMLLVGHYWRKSGGRPAWAHATGTHIRYYSGEGIQVNPLIQDIQSSKVYYGTPFNAMSGIHDSSNTKPRMTVERKFERALVESVINFIFLKKGQLVWALDLESPDMLGSFRLACRNFAQYQKMPRTDTRSLDEELLDIQAENAAVQEQAQFIQGYSGGNGLAFRSGSSALTLPAKRSFVDLTDSASDDASQGSNKRLSPSESAVANQDAEIYAGLEQEVQALRAKLEQQEAKIDASEAEVMRQKAKRRTLRTQREEWKEKYIAQQSLTQAPAESVKEEEESEDWKGMLFEQERKTEHYKLKYIALKEEKRNWQVQVREQVKDIADDEAVIHPTGTGISDDHIQEGDRVKQPSEHGGKKNALISQTKPRAIRPTERKDAILLRESLTKYWMSTSESMEKYFDGRNLNRKRRKDLVLDELTMMAALLLHEEQLKGVDVKREDVKRRAYIQAVEQTEHLMETQGVLVKAKKAKNRSKRTTLA
ncbi:uncharacterized protein J4E92_001158 [Alternaria infectoria]|uniref:uncharacterized protein n=1 Tax=Alternaria infectoria TaxID=45303 RepID=UPI00221FF852|nr:uncharacterized protein J4E92_001158 [Alternaria infectoria]KAI4939872.1 hypothetical protein J4E92_001158 [Alternaria infectoria]